MNVFSFNLLARACTRFVSIQLGWKTVVCGTVTKKKTKYVYTKVHTQHIIEAVHRTKSWQSIFSTLESGVHTHTHFYKFKCDCDVIYHELASAREHPAWHQNHEIRIKIERTYAYPSTHNIIIIYTFKFQWYRFNWASTSLIHIFFPRWYIITSNRFPIDYPYFEWHLSVVVFYVVCCERWTIHCRICSLICMPVFFSSILIIFRSKPHQ